jgi:hypothetical protein
MCIWNLIFLSSFSYAVTCNVINPYCASKNLWQTSNNNQNINRARTVGEKIERREEKERVNILI